MSVRGTRRRIPITSRRPGEPESLIHGAEGIGYAGETDGVVIRFGTRPMPRQSSEADGEVGIIVEANGRST